MKKLFEPAGYNVITECDPVNAVTLADKERPDCVLLDIKMPKVDGMEVLSRIKGIDKSISVIMITGYGNIQTAMESMKLGAYDYITKPFDLEFLKTMVKRCLETKRK